MIYVITPYLTDAVLTCAKEGFECPVKGGRLLNQNIEWVYDWQQLLNRKIFKNDKILWGEKTKDFDPELLKKIQEEIESRRTSS